MLHVPTAAIPLRPNKHLSKQGVDQMVEVKIVILFNYIMYVNTYGSINK